MTFDLPADGQRSGTAIRVPLAGIPDEHPVHWWRTLFAELLRRYGAEDRSDIALTDDLAIEADSGMWSEATLADLARHLATLARHAAERPDQPITTLALLTADERAAMLRECTDTAVNWPECGYLDLVGGHDPATLAVVHGSRQLTYGELDTLSNRLAHRLIGLGAGEGERVGLLCHRSADFVVAVIAILKTGAAAVLLDPVNPDARIAYMLTDSAPVAVLTSAVLASRVTDPVLIEQPLDTPDTRPNVAITGDTISHLIYTSGSTGEPKAVLERHAALVNLVYWTGGAYGVRRGDRASWLSTPGFAVQIMEWMPYLGLGVTVCIADAAEAQTPGEVRDWLVAQRITHTMLVAALAERVWGLDWPAESCLRILVTTAERVHSWPPEATGFRVVMTYGSTETTNVLTCLDLRAGIDFTTPATPESVRAVRPVPVGRPIANTRVYLLDDADQPVPVGVVGRLHVAGAGLAAGYHNQPDLTERKFRRDVVGEARLYDTGDLARYRADGAIELLGRSDVQIKVRGFRVELGEVETVVAAAPDVTEAVVVAREDTPGDVRIIAYVVPGTVDGRRVRTHVAQQLPHYMVPSLVVALDALPRLANGKLALRDLPEPRPAARANLSADYAGPRNDAEAQLAGLWESLFRVDQVGVDDNFFELGGHSLLAFQLIDAIRTGFGAELSLPDLYRAPTVAGLTELIALRRNAESGEFGGIRAIVPDPSQRLRPFPLTDSQQALWIGRGDAVELGNVGCHGYFEWDSPDLDLDRFEAAWRRLVERHDALRTVIRPDGTQQILDEVPDYSIEVEDLSGGSEEAVAARLAELREQLAHQVLDVERWPLFDVRLTRLPGGRTRLHLSVDFLICDAWSYFQVLVPDLARFYASPEEDRAPLELTFRDYVVGTAEALPDSEVYRRSEWYWLDRLTTLPPAPALPQRPAHQPALVVRFDRREHRLTAAEWQALKANATERGITGSGLLTAVLAEVLRAWTGQGAFTLNFPLFNRLPLHPQINEMVGDTTTTLLVAVDKADGTFTRRAQAVQVQLWADLEHRYFSGVQVLRALTRQRGSMAPAMPIVMTSLVGHPPKPEGRVLGTPVYAVSQTPQVSLDCQVFEETDGLRVNWDFLPALVPDGFFEAMFDTYATLLHRLIDDASTWDLPSLDVGGAGAVVTGAMPRGPRDTGPAWERYWAGIERTGSGGDVLWDADSGDELAWCVEQAAAHLDTTLPVIDVGCGNGRYVRALAGLFPAAYGVDVSASAIDRAAAETTEKISYRVVDAAQPAAARDLANEVGPANVFVRGVLHVLDDAARAGFAQSAAVLTGAGGVLFLMEPAYAEESFGYLGFVGGARGRAAALVAPLERAGVGHSIRFGDAELDAFFPSSQWKRLASGPVELHAIDPDSDASALRLPGYYAILRRQPV